MNIPKQLQGKEVKRFIDWIYPFEADTWDDFRFATCDIIDFYNQPFKAEIKFIKRLFNVGSGSFVDDGHFYYELKGEGKDYFSAFSLYGIENVDDFIYEFLKEIKQLKKTFPKSAGIKLIWEEGK